MTRKEIENIPKNVNALLDSSVLMPTRQKLDEKLNKVCELAIKALEQEPQTYKALKLLAEWAIECGFGYDNIPEQYETYKDDIADMGYAEGLVYIAQMESEG